MIVLEDSRQKPEKNAHIRKQIEDLGYKVDRTKLYCGDYTWATDQRICIDTKQDLQEVCSNVTQQHERFRSECIRAKEAGIRLIILIADPKISELSGVFSWFNPRRRYCKTATSGKTLAKIMYKMNQEYGVEWRFCTKETIGENILKLLQNN